MHCLGNGASHNRIKAHVMYVVITACLFFSSVQISTAEVVVYDSRGSVYTLDEQPLSNSTGTHWVASLLERLTGSPCFFCDATRTTSVVPSRMVAAAAGGNKCEGADMEEAKKKADKKNEEEKKKRSPKRYGPQLKYTIDDKGTPNKTSDEPVELAESKICQCHDSFKLADGQSCTVCKGQGGAETVKSGPAECAKKTSPKQEPKQDPKQEQKPKEEPKPKEEQKPKEDDKKGGGEPKMPEMPKKEDEKKDDKKDEKPWWWDDLYGKDKPTEAPKCTEDSVAATPQVIKKGEASTISWDVTGKGTLKTIINYVTKDERGADEKGSLGIVEGGSVDVSPERTTTYTIKVANEIGTTICKPPVKVLVKPADEDDETVVGETAEDLSLRKNKVVVDCDPARIRQGQQATVTWSCTAVTGSSFGASTEDGEFSTGGDTEGSVDVSPLRDATYVVRCRDKFGTEFARKSCRIEVSGDRNETTFRNNLENTNTSDEPPTVTISAQPPQAPKGTPVKVVWKSQNTASCVVYGPGCDVYGKDSPKCFKEVGRSGYITGNLYETSEFRVQCLAPDRKTRVSDSVTIDISSDDEEESSEEESSE